MSFKIQTDPHAAVWMIVVFVVLAVFGSGVVVGAVIDGAAGVLCRVGAVVDTIEDLQDRRDELDSLRAIDNACLIGGKC